jgi:hypothetical protein
MVFPVLVTMRKESLTKSTTVVGFFKSYQKYYSSWVFQLKYLFNFVIAFKRKMVWKLIIYVSQRLFINLVLHRHVCIVFLPNPPIAISNLPRCSSHGEVTFIEVGYIASLRVCELRVCEFTVGIYCLENAHLSVILCAFDELILYFIHWQIFSF